MLELYATEGLNPGSVHLAQLKLGQGLVGTIAASARPLNLSDAQTHPAFAYLPETGEEIYNSFLGVPVLRAGARSACWSCRTGPSGTTATTRSRRWKRRRW